MPRSPHWSLSLRFPHQYPIHPPLLTHTRHMSSPSHSSRFYHPQPLRALGFIIRTHPLRYQNVSGYCDLGGVGESLFVPKILPATQTRCVSKIQNFRIVKWLVRLVTAAERSNTIRSQMVGGGGLPLISVMTAVNLPHGSRNRSVGNPTYWGIIDYVLTSSRDTNGLVVVAAMRCDRRSDGEIYLTVVYSRLW